MPELDGTNSEAFIIVNFARKLILIGGTSYAGEIKKSVFTILHYYLPQKEVLSMHCSANEGHDGDTALFFGLSGTGKTSLSADPERKLIGDDEHGWGMGGIFNFEGGCYAKVIRLSPTAEPEIYECTRRFGTILENVGIDLASRRLDLDDDSLTENTRAAYPITHLQNIVRAGHGGPPQAHLYAGLRRLRGPAAHRPADPGTGRLPFPQRLHRQGGGHRAGHGQRTSGHLQHLLRGAFFGPAARGLRQALPGKNQANTSPPAGW